MKNGNTAQSFSETITGTIDVITYRNDDNGFFVCKVKIKGKLFGITGATPVKLSVGEIITASGSWRQHPKYGMQFQAQEVQVMLPKTTAGIQKYLGSGIIKGIGPTLAKRIVEEFGDKSIEIIENSPDKLTRITRISRNKADKIAKAWADNLKIREVMLFLQTHDVTVNLATKIYNQYGDAAINILRENPYMMARDVKGIGFLSADKIARNLGISPDDPKRIAAGVEHALFTATSVGSCALPMTILIEKTYELLQVNRDLIESAIHDSLVADRLIAMPQDECKTIECQKRLEKISFHLGKQELTAWELLALNPLIFVKPFFFMERNIATKLRDIARTGTSIFSDLDIEAAIQTLEAQHNINLADVQKDAIRKLKESKVMVITGGPGTGKTTLIKSILKIAKLCKQQIGEIRIKLAAPTGRAAKRITESTGMYASTVHRMLEFDPGQGRFKYNDANYLKCDLMVLDEASMIDVQMMNAIMKALPRHVTLIIVGDIDQLPSVGPGQVLADIIASNSVPTVKLQQIFRQAQNSKIITNAHMVNKGSIPYLGESDKKSDFEFVSVDDDLSALEAIKKVIKQYSDDVQVLTPMQRGSVGVKAINPLLQELLNQDGLQQEYIEQFGIKYCIGDKVIQTENNYNKCVFNGDIGYIKKIDKEEGELIINFDGCDILYEVSELDQLSLAYAITIHKSQGSEYQTVIMPILTQHFIMLNKNLLYTGITRAKKKLILVGQKKAVAMAVKNMRSETRYSMLKGWLTVEDL